LFAEAQLPGCRPSFASTASAAGRLVVAAVVLLAIPCARCAAAQSAEHRYFVDCASTNEGDGTTAHPWNSLQQLSSHDFQPGEIVFLRRGTTCKGELSLHGSGSADSVVRLTAYGAGARPRIVATRQDTQAVLLKNAEYWQIDSLDIAGGNTYGLLVTGDQDKVQSHITLRNLVVHDVQGGEVKNKDNGLVVFLRGSQKQRFDDVLIDDVVAAHTNQWAGIMMGAGDFYSEEDGYNRNVVIRNSVVHDVYGDGIVLFRVRRGLIDASTAWLTGQQPTQNVGTPNAIWTWSCTDCVVSNNESFLTESPGVDGGAYDIDWATTRNTIQHNYAHDTQGYCIAVFGAGYVTHDAVVRDNICVDNGLSPRMARLQGAVYLHTWNDGSIDNLTIENNTIVWNPPAPAAPIVNEQDTELKGNPVVFLHNVIRSTSPLLAQSFGDKLAFSDNRYVYRGDEAPHWNWNGKTWHSLTALQAAGGERDSTLDTGALNVEENPVQAGRIRLVAEIPLILDADGLFAADTMAQLAILRTLAREYSPSQLQIEVRVPNMEKTDALSNALVDFDTPSIRFVPARAGRQESIRLIDTRGRIVGQWPASSADFNAATLAYAVRRQLGVPIYAQMDPRP
jgi:hypothetical protein